MNPINEKELSVGNWIIEEGEEEPMQIEAGWQIDFGHSYPIELSEEWLRKLGAKPLTKEEDEMDWVLDNVYFKWLSFDKEVLFGAHGEYRIKYVHNFQNFVTIISKQ